MNPHINTTTQFIDLGLIDYQQAWDYQTDLFNKNLQIKKQNRDLPSNEQRITNNHLIFCEHPHVYTLGKSGDEKNLLIKKEDLHAIQASFYAINRGGDITYHGPGQLVVYPVIDLENFFTDIHQYMRLLEEAVIHVWIDFENGAPRKICALGVKTSRWVTMHGLAFNVNTDLNYFNHIVPCGIDDKAVTSLQKEMGARLPMEQVKSILKEKIVSLFGMVLIP